MAKLELDLKHGDSVVGSTSVDINMLPQFGLKFFSARPNKIPIDMVSTALPSLGGIDVGPQQPRDGFLSGNVYTIEVTVLNMPPGSKVELSSVVLTQSGDYIVVSATQQFDGPKESIMDVVPINEGKTNAAGIAEFQVKFRKDSIYHVIAGFGNWSRIQFRLSTTRGEVTLPTVQAIVEGGNTYPNGYTRRLNLSQVADQVIKVAPGQYGFWIDIMLGAGGGGHLSLVGGDSQEYDLGEDGGSVALFISDPKIIPHRYHKFVNYWEVDNVPIAFAEGGKHSDYGPLIPRGGAGVGTPIATAANNYLRSLQSGVDAGNNQHMRITAEVAIERNGSTWEGGGFNFYHGGYQDPLPIHNGDVIAGEGWQWLGHVNSGTGSYVKMRLHYRRTASGGNRPMRPLILCFKSESLASGVDATVPLIGPMLYNGSRYENAPPHTPAMSAISDLIRIKSSSDGGKGSAKYSAGGQNGGNGVVAITDFGYYATYA